MAAKLKMLGTVIRTMDTRPIKVAPKTAEPFYLSPEWRKLMAEIIAERGRRCEDPTCDGKTHRLGMRVFGDHLVELRDGGAPLDKRNIMLRCGASHTKKTLAERAKRMAARP
ncbi:HNH endonuclease [Mesorhizobium sp. M0129]|uniref:HNH endonuclease n=1 Tax=Mesorhizobium sp. M0129 TaxID=2956886 RepID=UPI0033352948